MHELGHVVDYWTDEDGRAGPVTEYAESNRSEAFAEAFTAFLVPGYLTWGVDDLRSQSELMQFFDTLRLVPFWERARPVPDFA